MVAIFSVLASMPRLEMMNPKTMPWGTPRIYLSGLILMPSASFMDFVAISLWISSPIALHFSSSNRRRGCLTGRAPARISSECSATSPCDPVETSVVYTHPPFPPFLSHKHRVGKPFGMEYLFDEPCHH
jgi:hypothetical protein